MHGLFITFECAASIDDLTAPFTDDAAALPSQPGLVSKAWVSTDTGYGGLHDFTGRTAADVCLGSDLATCLLVTDGFGSFQVRHVDVLDDLSAMTPRPRPVEGVFAPLLKPDDHGSAPSRRRPTIEQISRVGWGWPGGSAGRGPTPTKRLRRPRPGSRRRA